LYLSLHKLCELKDEFLKYFLFRNILKLFFYFKKIILILAYQNYIKTPKKILIWKKKSNSNLKKKNIFKIKPICSQFFFFLTILLFSKKEKEKEKEKE
jgi:hypothetical protein